MDKCALGKQAKWNWLCNKSLKRFGNSDGSYRVIKKLMDFTFKVIYVFFRVYSLPMECDIIGAAVDGIDLNAFGRFIN